MHIMLEIPLLNTSFSAYSNFDGLYFPLVWNFVKLVNFFQQCVSWYSWISVVNQMPKKKGSGCNEK